MMPDPYARPAARHVDHRVGSSQRFVGLELFDMDDIAEPTPDLVARQIGGLDLELPPLPFTEDMNALDLANLSKQIRGNNVLGLPFPGDDQPGHIEHLPRRFASERPGDKTASRKLTLLASPALDNRR